MDAEQQKELTDVALCYQAMGIALDATPAQIDKLYKSLTEEFKNKMASPDPALREDARVNLEQVREMYEKIRGSITYHAMEKEYLKSSASAVPPGSKKSAPQNADNRVRVHCPRCNGLIPKELRSCPICRSPLYSATELSIRAFLTPKKLILSVILAAAVALVVLGLQYPEKFNTKVLQDLLQQAGR